MLIIKSPSPTISIEKFDIDKENRVLRISGRSSRLIGFLMSLAGLSPTSTFTLLFDRLILKQTRIGAETRMCFPLAATESVESGERRSPALLIVAFVLLIAGLNVMFNADPLAGIIPLGIALVCAIGYFFSKKSYIAAYAGSQVMMIVFKKASIGGKTIDPSQLKAAVRMLNDRVTEAQSS